MPVEQMTASTFLVQELRQARVAAELSQEDLGRAISYSASLVSAVETGQRPPSREYVVAVDRALNKGGLFERLLSSIVSLDQAPVWFRDWIVFEREATLIRWYEQSLVPGLLQTEAYARAILEGGGLRTEAEIERSVAGRLIWTTHCKRRSSTNGSALISFFGDGRRSGASPCLDRRPCN
jgi:transcriptional regulator with XRE-family HTH domain